MNIIELKKQYDEIENKRRELSSALSTEKFVMCLHLGNDFPQVSVWRHGELPREENTAIFCLEKGWRTLKLGSLLFEDQEELKSYLNNFDY